MDYKGKTALITGASSGLGVAYAEEFAKRGSNLILVARRADLLEQVGANIKKTASVDVTVIPMDLGTLEAGEQLVQAVASKSLQVDFLVNNAGFGTNNPLAKEDRTTIRQEIVLNVATLVDLTAAYLPPMKARNFGAIINIASTASYQPVPGMAVYGATKAFVRSFTSAVWGETEKTNVRVLTVSPGATATAFFDVAGAKPAGALAPISNVMKTTFKALDARRSRPAVIDGGANRFAAGLTTVLPKAFIIRTVARMFLKD